ncbi:MAG: hypothetical protein PVF43_15180 [Candidatus Eiseniibacteriota bacterium]|jgi:hypothetical protein
MAETFSEVYVEGETDIVRGFVAGFLSGAATAARVFVNVDHGVADDGIARQMAERVHLIETVTHLIVDDRLRPKFLEGIGQHGDRLGIHSRGTRGVRAARCSFDWEVYSPDEAMKVRRLFENERPAAVGLEGYAPEQIVHEGEGKTGMYTPTHGFVVKATGHAEGPPDDLIDWVARLGEDGFIHVGRIELVYAEDDPGPQ